MRCGVEGIGTSGGRSRQLRGQVMSPDVFGPWKGTSPQVSTDKSREGETHLTDSKPSLYDRIIGKDFDEVQEGDTFWFSKSDPAGGSYKMPGRKDSTTDFGYDIPDLPANKVPKDYQKVKTSTLPK